MFENDDDFNFDISLENAFTSTQKTTDKEKKVPTNNCKQQKIVSPSVNNRKIVLRKFPGPAGLLLDLKNTQRFNSNQQTDIICSQSSVTVFGEEPWLRMCNDFETTNLPQKYNISWIKTKASTNKLINSKAPFLAAIIQNIESCNNKMINLTLKDITGEIQATILQDLFDKHSKDLIFGAVIVLKQCSILTTDCDSHNVTITTKNLVRIYAKNKITDVQCLTCDDLIKIINQVKNTNKRIVLNSQLCARNNCVQQMNSPRLPNISKRPLKYEYHQSAKKVFKFQDFKRQTENNQCSSTVLQKQLNTQTIDNQCSTTVLQKQLNTQTVNNQNITKEVHNIFDGIDFDTFLDDF